MDYQNTVVLGTTTTDAKYKSAKSGRFLTRKKPNTATFWVGVKRPNGRTKDFMVTAFDDWAEKARNIKKGQRVTVAGIVSPLKGQYIALWATYVSQ